MHPVENVAAAVDPRHADVLTDRQRDRPAGAVDLVGELQPGRRGADDEDAAVVELRGIAVVERRDLADRARHALR